MKTETERAILADIEAARADGQLYADTGFEHEPLGSDVYVSEARYQAEVERILWRSWIPVARTSELPEPGQWLLRSVERAEVVITRDPDGSLHAFHNTCLHRGSALVTSDGCGKRLVCPYHAWTYTLDGQLANVPELRAYPPGFDPKSLRLGPVGVAVKLGWIWVNLRDQGRSLEDFLGEQLLDELSNWQFEEVEHKGRVVREEPFGWKVGVEGFLEPYHVPFIHKRTVNPLINNRIAAMGWWGDHSRMVLPLREPRLYESDGLFGRIAAGADVSVLPKLNTVQRMANMVYLIWPSTILNMLPNHISVFHLHPMSVGRTRVVLDIYGGVSASDAARAFWERLVAGYGPLLDEDDHSFNGVQRGLSGAFQPELTFSHYDRRIRHFRSRVAAWLGP